MAMAWILLAAAAASLLWRWRSFRRIAAFKARRAIIVDVRTPDEFRRGHAEGALNLPLDQLASGAARLERSLPLLVCCASGARSAVAARRLRAEGFEAINAGSWTRLR